MTTTTKMRNTMAALLIAGSSLLGLAPIASAASIAGDDNGDGIVMEDESGWSCVDDGNRICGPGNSEGKPAACYDDGGVIVALWPCHVVVNSMGDADVYEGLG